MDNRRTTIESGPGKKRSRRHLLIVLGVLGLFALVLFFAGRGSISQRPPDGKLESESKAQSPVKKESERAGSQSPVKTDSSADNITLIEDDGQTLWVSPTDGEPLDLAYLPPGVQLVLAIRFDSIAKHPEGGKLATAIGPTLDDARRLLAKELPDAEIERAVFGFGVESDGRWKASKVVRLAGDETGAKYMASRFPNAIAKKHGDQTYWVVDDRAYYVPESENGRTIVIAPVESITDVIDLAGDAPPLRRDVERLLAHTDSDRDITLVVIPNSLFSEGSSMFEGQMTRLQEPLFWFLGDELSAAALSLDWGDNFFFELIATPTLDTRTEQVAKILVDRVHEIPDKLEAYVVGLDPQPYGRLIVARFPAMVRKLSAYTRSGFDSDHAVLRGYLPAVAGHNLLMGAELTLAESSGGGGPVAETASPVRSGPEADVSIEGKLRQSVSLRFARDTLEAALQQLSEDIGVPIVIRGPDLQADGITKNQSFGIALEGKPAAEVLTEILRLANPDKTATSTNDVKQKLVYVVAPGEGGVEQIFITTRAAAEARGDELPAVFQASP